MDLQNIKIVAFDLDGTLTQHKEPLCEQNRKVLIELAKRYRLVMVGAGGAMRIFNQLGQFPIDVIGNYGLQFAEYNHQTKELETKRDETFPCDKESVDKRVRELRQKYGFTEFVGDNVEFHPSGCITFPILGTKAKQQDKLAFDPDRSKRRAIYQDVCQTFSEYTVFVGGSSSFDMCPSPYNKYYAFDKYCNMHGVKHNEAVFVGDDYGLGGNDSSVYNSDFNFITIDDYRTFPEVMKPLLK